MERFCLPRGALAAFVVVIHGIVLHALLGAAPDVQDRSPGERYALQSQYEPKPDVLWTKGTLTASALTEPEAAMARRILSGGGWTGDGGGASVSELVLIQTNFSDVDCNPNPVCGGPCNSVLLVWRETDEKPDGVEIIVNDISQGVVAGLPADRLPGVNGTNLGGVPAGTFTFEIASAANGTSAEAVIEVLDSPPMADAKNLACAETSAGDGSCLLEATWENGDPPPDYYEAFLPFDRDGVPPNETEFLGRVDGVTTGFTEPAPAGQHCVTLVAFRQAAENVLYQGCFVERCCELTCADTCNPPVELALCQVAYGEGATDNAVLASWQNSADYERIDGFVDDEGVGSLPGTPTSAVFGLLAPGEHTIGIEGVCDGDLVSARTADTLLLLTATPHPEPIIGEPLCAWSPEEGGTSTVTWTNNDAAPSAFISVSVFDGMDRGLLGFLAGSSTVARISGAAETDVIVLQFFVFQGGACYGSEAIAVACGAPGGLAEFRRGDSDAIDGINVTDGVFLLNFLFLGGPPPPCRDAADANDDGALNVTTAVYIFNWLFLGGPLPPAPGPTDCGEDPTADELDCAAYADCVEV